MKTKAIIIAGFVIAFAAGLVVGRLSELPAVGVAVSPVGPPPHGSRENWLAKELGLDVKQAEAAHRIWSEAMGAAHREEDEKRRQIRAQRDEELAALVGLGNAPKLEEIMQRYSERQAAIGRERGKAFEKAVADTKAILNDEQRAKYEELLTRRPGGPGDRGGPGDHGGPGGRGRRGPDRPGSRPTTR